MSRHSKNNTSQSIFTYGQKQKLKGEYGTKEQRISQDSIKKFQMCTICNNSFIQPVCCTGGHIFCKACAIQFMVKQKNRNAEFKKQAEAFEKKKQQQNDLKNIQQKAKKIIKFEKYDNFEALTNRKQFVQEDKDKSKGNCQKIDPNESKPVGVYQLTSQKQKYVKTSFWATQNTPHIQQKISRQNIDDAIKCPAGTNHKLTLKKLRALTVKKLEQQYCCGICNKQIRRQKIGNYRCGHVVCFACKSDKCEICNKKQGWIQIQSSSSSFAGHNKAQVKTYTHAFYI